MTINPSQQVRRAKGRGATGNTKVTDIISGIRGSVYHYYSPPHPLHGDTLTSLFLYPFVDYLMLLYQRPCCISLWADVAGRKGFFSSLAPQDALFLGLRNPSENPPESLDSGPSRHIFSVPGEVTVEVASLFKDQTLDPTTVEDLKRVVKPFVEEIKYSVVAHTYSRPVFSRTHQIDHIRDAVAPEMRETLLTPLRKRLDYLLERLSHTKMFSRSDYPPGVLNLIAGFQHYLEPWERIVYPPKHDSEDSLERRPCKFPYSASLILSAGLREWVDQNLHSSLQASLRKNPKVLPEYHNLRPSQILELSLSKQSRAIADTIFSTGIVDFGDPRELKSLNWSRNFSPDDATQDTVRRLAEDIFYPYLLKARKVRTFFIPIHVGGIPWMTLYTFATLSQRSVWRRNYFIYRDVIPALAGTLREASQHAYAEALSSQLKMSLEEAKTDVEVIDLVNSYWSMATRAYPFERIALEKSDFDQDTSHVREHKTLRLPGGTMVSIESKNNELFGPRLPIGTLVQDLVIDQMRQTISFASQIRLSGQLGALKAITHVGLNLLTPIDSGVISLSHFFSGTIPPQKFKVNVLGADRIHSEAEEMVIPSLKSMYTSVASLRMALQFADVAAARGQIRESICSQTPYHLSSVLHDSAELARIVHHNSPTTVAFPLLEGDSPGKGVIVGGGYLSSDLLRTIVYEIILNAAKHGQAEHTGGRRSITIRTSTEISKDSRRIILILESPIREDDSWSVVEEIAVPENQMHSPRFRDSFLFRLRSFANATGSRPGQGIQIATSVDCNKYTARLTLGSILVLADGGDLVERFPL